MLGVFSQLNKLIAPLRPKVVHVALPQAARAQAMARTARSQDSQGTQALMIPCPDPTAEDRMRDYHQSRGQFLARQEMWDVFARELREAEQTRAATPGGMSIADLLSYGARADVVLAVEHALIEGTPPKDAPVLDGIEALEEVLRDHMGDYAVASMVAQAHMDLGWAWRGNGWDAQVPERNRLAFQAHFDRAGEILSDFSDSDLNSPVLAATRCSHLCGSPKASRLLTPNYEALIDLNPKNPGPMRAMGNYLLPRWFGTYQELEVQARRTAARTQELWGAGGYTWVMFDAISGDDQACAQLDLEFFIEGLRDILNRNPHQHTVNLLAAYCANTIGNTYSGHDQADYVRLQIAECAAWIVREYLTELHPMIWAHAARGFDNTLRVRSARNFAAAGQADALRIIAQLFKKEIAEGYRIIFTSEGPVAEIV